MWNNPRISDYKIEHNHTRLFHRNRLDVVEFFVSKPSVRSTVSDIHLKKFPDFAPLVKRLEKKRVSLQDLYRIYVAILKIPALVDDLRDATVEDCKPRTAQLLSDRFLSPFTQFFSQFQNYQELIKHTVDIDYIRRTGEYRILPAVDDDLLGTLSNVSIHNVILG